MEIKCRNQLLRELRNVLQIIEQTWRLWCLFASADFGLFTSITSRDQAKTVPALFVKLPNPIPQQEPMPAVFFIIF